MKNTLTPDQLKDAVLQYRLDHPEIVLAAPLVPKTALEEISSPFVNADHAGKQDARKERLEQRADKAQQRSDDLYQSSRSAVDGLPFGQPILVGHHSEGKHRRALDKSWSQMGRAVEESKKAVHLASRADAVGSAGISSTDPEAVTKLKAKLAKLESAQDTMKTANKAIKKGDIAAIAGLSLSVKSIDSLLTHDCYGGVGFASYSLTNNGAEIRRTKKRIAELLTLHQQAPIDFENDDFKMFIEDGQIRVVFHGGKPSESIRTLLKRTHAFKWSRYSTAWVRKVTGNAMYAGRQLLESLKDCDAIY